MNTSAAAPVILLSGDRGSGKTTACGRLAEELVARGFRAAGVLCPSIRDDSGVPLEINVKNIADGTVRLFAARGRDLGGPFWPPGGGGFGFSAAAIEWALGVVRAGMNERADIVVIDEIGPLELTAGQGFLPAIDYLRSLRDARHGSDFASRVAPAVLLTIRPGLAGRLAALAGAGTAVMLEPDAREDSFRRLLSVALSSLPSKRLA